MVARRSSAANGSLGPPLHTGRPGAGSAGCEVKGARIAGRDWRGPSGVRQFTFYRIHLSLPLPSIQFTDQNATERIPGGIVPPLASELCEYSHHAGIASFQTYVAWWIEPEARSCFIVSAVHGPCCAFAVSR